MKTEIKELLTGFEKRMKFIYLCKSIWDYRYPDDIKKMIDENTLKNVIVAVLLFIKEKTLSDNQRCELKDVEYFLDELIGVFYSENVDTKILAKYVIVDVLQNGGLLHEYLSYDSKTQKYETLIIRLINEEKNSYRLTDEAYDFLFRTKEIESELDYSITRFKLKEYMKRNNYEQALDTSRELVTRIRKMKIAVDEFLIRCKEDITNIPVDKYEFIVKDIRSLLESEHKELLDIQKLTQQRQKALVEGLGEALSSDETERYINSLIEISQNISHTIEEQRTLINKRTNLSNEYQQLLEDSFSRGQFERMSFEKDIMVPLRQLGDKMDSISKYLLSFFSMPNLKKMFSIENFYSIPSTLREEAQDDGFELDTEVEDVQTVILKKHDRYVSICKSFFKFASEKVKFRISEYVDSLTLLELKDFAIENALPNFLLTICAMQELDFKAYTHAEKFLVEPTGELELDLCLEAVDPSYLQLEKMHFYNLFSSFSISIRQDDTQKDIDITDFEVEVDR